MAEAGPSVAAVVLAAGQGTRFARGGRDLKLLAQMNGAPLVRHVVTAALQSQAAPVIVVTGHEERHVRPALAGLPVEAVNNPDYAQGLASSLKRGIGAVPQTCAGALVLLGDMPLVRAGLLDRLIAAFASRADCDAVIPVHEGRRGNPVLLARAMFPAVQSLQGDEGARRVLAQSAQVLEVPVNDRAVTVDIDTPEMLRAEAARGILEP